MNEPHWPRQDWNMLNLSLRRRLIYWIKVGFDSVAGRILKVPFFQNPFFSVRFQSVVTTLPCPVGLDAFPLKQLLYVPDARCICVYETHNTLCRYSQELPFIDSGTVLVKYNVQRNKNKIINYFHNSYLNFSNARINCTRNRSQEICF